MLDRVQSYPLVVCESHCDFQFLYGAGDLQEPHFLVYEIARDFLSAPRSYAIVAITTLDSDAIDLNSDSEYPAVEYDEQGDMLECGLFQYLESEWTYERDQIHLIVSFPGRRIELVCHHFELVETLVARSARHALAVYLEGSL